MAPGLPAIVGVGHARQGRLPGVSPRALALEAARNAILDAGLKASDIDGVLVQGNGNVYPVDVAGALGIEPVFSSCLMPYGTSAALLAQEAALAVGAGVASVVLCCYGNSGLSLVGGGVPTGHGFAGDFTAPYGSATAAANYAQVASRHMALYGTTRAQLGAVAVAAREWAQRNPAAQHYRRPLDMATYLEGRWVAEPLTVHDCCLLSDGGRAFIVTTAERAGAGAKPPVFIRGFGERTAAETILTPESRLVSPAREALRIALSRAGLALADIGVFQVYDCFTPAVIVTLEDYGLCEKGEGGPFVAGGRLAPGGPLPVNTSGGLLAEVYLHSWTQLTEAVLQVRGEAGARQVQGCETALVGASGGTFQHHVVLLLSR